MTHNNDFSNTSNSTETDEIDLFELCATLWKEKVLIIVITILFTVLAVIYVLIVTPVYQSTAAVLPPKESDLIALNPQYEDSKLKKISPDDAYIYFSQELESSDFRDQFYTEVFLPSLKAEEQTQVPELLRRKLNEALSVETNLKDSPKREVTVTLKADPQKAQEWANLYITMAGDNTKDKILHERNSELNNIIEGLTKKIDLLRKKAENERIQEIVRLEEAYDIAKAVGIEEPQKPEGKVTSEGANYVDRNLPYLRGANALEAQIKALKTRENNDPFISQLPSLLEQLSFYESLSFSPTNFSVYTFDQPAKLADFPMKPKKKLIVVIGFLLGGIIGIAIVLVKVAIRNRKNFK